MENAVAAIRVSSVKQGTDGDSPEAQREQIERFAETHNINIRKIFVFLESGSKEKQPVQEAIDYCKNPKNNIQLFIIKSIDRFTRGGSYFYDGLKMQLDQKGVKLIDIYGVIGTHDVNTLEHLGVSYNWSVYSPTKKAEMLEAERAKDEMRDIMSRMIGAQIRYIRMGYWVHRAPFGYMNEKVETSNGKRVLLKPEPTESVWIIKMFELRARGTLDDHQIVDTINSMGFKTRIELKRNPKNRTQIIGQKGGNKLTLKALWRFIENPIYAGIHVGSWNKGFPIKGRYAGLVSFDIFNKANKGKITIREDNGEIKVYKREPKDYLVQKGVKNSEFPYKKYVLCPHCMKPLYGSASRGKLGKYYPAYHCNKRGHYFRVPKKDFDATISKFIKNINLSQEYIDALQKVVLEEWDKRSNEINKDKVNIDQRISELKMQSKATVDKIKYLQSEVAIKYLEADLIENENEIEKLMVKKEKETKEPVNMVKVMEYIKYFLEHLDNLLLQSDNPIDRATYFSAIFNHAPTYQELISGTPDLADCISLNKVFIQGRGQLSGMQGLEPQTSGPKPGVMPFHHIPIY